MKTFFSKLVLWLPLAFLVLVLADIFFIHEYFFRTRYSVLQTPSFVGLTISLIIATIFEATATQQKHGLRTIYRWYVAIPLIILMILLTLTSMNR